jgi:G3E family GTPase
MRAALPFTVVGGYLGAGKTTLLNHLLTNTSGLRIAVLVNDFGSVNIDAELIRDHNGDTINLANGCMCCSLVNGFAAAVGAIRQRAAEFDHLVIEASGVADPAKIAQYGQMYELPLDGIVVVVDAEQVRAQSTNKYVGDTVLRQFEQADLIVLNKIDLVSAEERRSLRAWLTDLAPGTPVIETTGSEVPIDVLLGAHEGRLPRRGTDHQAPENHAELYETWTIERVAPLSRDALQRFAQGLGPDVYRAKGFVLLQGDTAMKYVFQQVGARWTLEQTSVWSDEPRRTRVVIIGRAGATSLLALQALVDGRSNHPVMSINAERTGGLRLAAS